MAKAIHMMVRVLDEARSVKFYEDCFGLKVAERREWPDFSLTYMRNAANDFEVELTVNKGRTSHTISATAMGMWLSWSTIWKRNTRASKRRAISPKTSRR